MVDAGYTPNPPSTPDAGTGDVPDAAFATPRDAGVDGRDDAGGCPQNYFAVDGGCSGPVSLQLSALAAADGDALYAGGGPQPIFVARLLDPRGWVPAEAQAMLQITQTTGRATFVVPFLSSALDETHDSPRAFRRVLDTRPLTEGAYDARALLMFDGGVLTSNTLTLFVDRTAPTLTLSFPGLALDGGPLPRDFVATARLHAFDDAAGVSSLRLQGAGSSVDSSSGRVTANALVAEWPIQQLTGDASSWSAQADVHATDIPFDTGGDQAGSVVLLATATDRAGNSTQVELSIALTRLKWSSAQVSGSRDGLVLGGTGRVYGATAFDIWGLDPSGVSVFHASPGADATSRGAPMIRGKGEDQVDFSVVDFSGGSTHSRIEEVCGDGSQSCAPASYTPISGANFFSAPAFSTTKTQLVVADDSSCGFYVLDAFGGSPLASQFTDAGENDCPMVEVALSGLTVTAAGLLSNTINSWNDGGISLSGNVGSGNGYTAGVALSGTSAWFAVGDQLIGEDFASSPPTTVGDFTAGGVVAAPVIDGQGNIYLASDDGMLAKLDSTGSLLWSLSLSVAGEPGSPAIGSDGIVYVVDGSEALDAVDPEGHLLWKTGPLFAAAIRSPMIDPCTHTLYVTAADLRGVEAVIVDSAGLDQGPQAWPVYRHDYFGTGDAKARPTIDCTDHL
jgi:outer membrane protein assembly factor BamB